MKPSEDEQAATEGKVIGILDLRLSKENVTVLYVVTSLCVGQHVVHNQSPVIVFFVFCIM